MGYREDLEAAMARVAALESELKRARGGEAQERLRQATAELDSARQRAQALEAELSAARRKLEALERERRKELRERARGDKPSGNEQVRGLRSLFDHNRGQAPLSGKGAGVLCPRCLAAGERVELKQGKLTMRMAQEHAKQVWCPRCAEVGWKRG